MVARLVALACLIASLAAHAQESFPNRPISIIVPPAAGMADLSARPWRPRWSRC